MKTVQHSEVTHPTKEQIHDWMIAQRDEKTRSHSIEETRRMLGWEMIQKPYEHYK